MTLYLTRDMDTGGEDEAETILWEVGENDPLPRLREDGRWFSDSLQALFPLTEQPAVPPGRIVRVHLDTTKPCRRARGRPPRSGKPGSRGSAADRPAPHDMPASRFLLPPPPCPPHGGGRTGVRPDAR